ncbi:SGNH/GDSL hydrolase family protein [Oxalobacteraceae bacterium R-40]|uniref:SGNH/GDSL hydrolase family protein n=1 Tax=Keguizhuia sedimenti TaxID=3064264 RepID=A0ABU1BK84_9BURK|nr:SGNH/GDSL hydrolase family protein [Oxalobacteraceae bacterium R-40]
MKKLFNPAVICFALSLAACGGGGGGDDGNGSGSSGGAQAGGQPQTPNAQKLASTAQVIDYYGDSTIWGWQTQTDGAQVAVPAPAAFAAALPATPAHTVNNLGVNGQTACELLAGTNGFDDWATRMDAATATTVVILNHGINDAVSANSVPVNQYRTCLTGLAQAAKAENKRVIFETPNPISDTRLGPYIQAMREVAAQEGLSVIDQYAYLTDQYGQDASIIAPDGLHPTDEIYRVKGAYAASEFLKLDK